MKGNGLNEKTEVRRLLYQHYNEVLVHQNENQKPHIDEHQLIIVKMVRDYLAHHDQAIQNLTNELLDGFLLSEKTNFYLK